MSSHHLSPSFFPSIYLPDVYSSFRSSLPSIHIHQSESNLSIAHIYNPQNQGIPFYNLLCFDMIYSAIEKGIKNAQSPTPDHCMYLKQ
ncbi:hypothetical protein VTL71DRAFT_15530 [Oculimacula yallundae]|uniref:Uncharacterized protein n=1 Tax=Oculimacula yallundae TaxID=86028 RepID=A0ABR4CHM0_9HELO